MTSLRLALASGHPQVAIFALSITVVAYSIGRSVEQRTGCALLNPVLLAIMMIGAVLRLLHIPYGDYFRGAQLLNFLLGPTVVALAIPLMRAIEHIRSNVWPMLLALMAGSMAGMISGYGLVRVFGGNQQLALTMLPKSLTTPIALEVSTTLGGLPSLCAVLAILAGVLTATVVNRATQLIGVHEPGAIGLAAGTAGSGIGASSVISQHSLSAAFAAVAIALNGLITAVLAPHVAKVLKHW